MPEELAKTDRRLSIEHHNLLQNPAYNRYYDLMWEYNEAMIAGDRGPDEYEANYIQMIKTRLTNQGIDVSDLDTSSLEFQVKNDEILEDFRQAEEAISGPEDQYDYEYYRKFKNLETAKDLDPGMYEILLRFNYLPFSTLHSCSGHFFPGTDEMTEEFFPALGFSCNFESTEEDSEIQLRFLNSINELNARIQQRIGIPGGVFFDLRGYLMEWADDNIEELDPQESMNRGLPLILYINIPDTILSQSHAKEILVIMWDEFIKTLKSIDPRDLPDPDFQNGDTFELRPKSN